MQRLLFQEPGRVTWCQGGWTVWGPEGRAAFWTNNCRLLKAYLEHHQPLKRRTR